MSPFSASHSSTLPHLATLAWELSVLSRAVEHLNLTAASAHEGISQPQLSRIVARLETELGIQLLDRAVRRKSTWTAAARELADVYSRSQRDLEARISSLVEGIRPKRMRVGTLEGLLEFACDACQPVFDREIETLEVDIHDLDALEALFLSGSLDLVFTSREIGKRKPRYSQFLGLQRLVATHVGGDLANDPRVMSHYEMRQVEIKRKKSEPKTLLSNSLALRRYWIETYGGVGVIPSRPPLLPGPQRKTDSGGMRGHRTEPVYAFGSDALPEDWFLAITRAARASQ